MAKISVPTENREAIEVLVSDLIEMATATHQERGEDGETFLECFMCATWEGHADDCPIPLLVKWGTRSWEDEESR